jgi:hypothetical protein
MGWAGYHVQRSQQQLGEMKHKREEPTYTRPG